MEHPPRATGNAEGADSGRETPLLQGYLDFLGQEGFRPWTDEGSPRTAYLRREVRTFALRVSKGDPDFVHLSLGFALDDGPYDELALLRAAMRCQGNMKVAKIWLSPALHFAEFQAELILGGNPLGLERLERCLALTRGLARSFFEAIGPEVPGAKA